MGCRVCNFRPPQMCNLQPPLTMVTIATRFCRSELRSSFLRTTAGNTALVRICWINRGLTPTFSHRFKVGWRDR